MTPRVKCGMVFSVIKQVDVLDLCPGCKGISVWVGVWVSPGAASAVEIATYDGWCCDGWKAAAVDSGSGRFVDVGDMIPSRLDSDPLNGITCGGLVEKFGLYAIANIGR